MEIVDATQINSFASQAMQADFVPPSEEAVFILTAGQLQTIISQAIQPLKDEVAALRSKVARLGELEEIYHGPSPQAEDIPLLRECWTKKREIMNELPSRMWAIEEDLSKLEETRPTATPETAKKPTQKTQDHITSIAIILGAKEKRLIEGQAPRAYVDRLRKEGLTFSELANVMGLTVDRIRQLAKIAAGDQRFNITWHPRKKNTKIIKLRRWDAFVL